jgi:opacity protein-like surface antigen
MGTAKSVLLAGAMTLLAYPAAKAADLPPIMPVKAPAVYDDSGWYLRGDIGMTNQRLGSISNPTAGPNVVVTKEFDSGWLFGAGVGYQVNNWLRFDVTGEYRGKTGFTGMDIATNNCCSEHITAQKSEWLVMANAYVDLGTWYGITPFIGAGVGGSRNTISGYTENSFNGSGPSAAYADSASKWNFAWAAHAGLAYRVTPGLTLELAYRYLDLGDAQSGDVIYYTGVNNVYNPTDFKDITSHDVKFGVRWMLAPEYSPLMRKG